LACEADREELRDGASIILDAFTLRLEPGEELNVER
jgi:hypothetical protein